MPSHTHSRAQFLVHTTAEPRSNDLQTPYLKSLKASWLCATVKGNAGFLVGLGRVEKPKGGVEAQEQVWMSRSLKC